MPNIFDGFNKLEDEDIRYQIATLETMTVANASKEMGQKAKRTAVKIVNVFAGFINNKQFDEPEVITIQEMLQTNKTKLDDVSREDLDKKLRKILIEKCNSAGAMLTNQATDDEISVTVIHTAAKAYKDINDKFTPAQKADSIQYRYAEKFLSRMQKEMSKQTTTEKNKTDQVIQEKIDDLTEKQREELKEALKVQELTGQTLGNILRSAAGPATVLAIVEISGFGAYIALTTIVHAIFTTVLGITLPFAAYTTLTSTLAFLTGPIGWIAVIGVGAFQLNRGKNKLIYEILAQMVWLSVNIYGKKFTPADEELPSWIPDYERDAAKKEEERYQSIMSENKEIRDKYNLLKKQINNNEAKRKSYNDMIQDFKRRMNESEYRVNNLELEKADLEKNILIINEELKLYTEKVNELNDSNQEESNAQILSFNSKLESLNLELVKRNKEILGSIDIMNQFASDIKIKENEIEKLQSDLFAKEIQIEALKEELDKSTSKVEKEIEGRKKEIEQRWTMCYEKFIFEKSAIADAVKDFERADLGRIEGALMELHQTTDKRSLSRGKMNGEFAHCDHMDFSIRSGFPCRILYEVIADGKKEVRIVKIYKHNNKFGS
ncbi:MAG: hypothetical protein K0S41_2690 [Anaerocolumna sp.]|jgi:hypothetical protein|nr:hypothetical protein [Anaerocolumna sp.]